MAFEQCHKEQCERDLRQERKKFISESAEAVFILKEFLFISIVLERVLFLYVGSFKKIRLCKERRIEKTFRRTQEKRSELGRMESSNI